MNTIEEEIRLATEQGFSDEEIACIINIFRTSYPELISIIIKGDNEFNKEFGRHPIEKEPFYFIYDKWLDRALKNTERDE